MKHTNGTGGLHFLGEYSNMVSIMADEAKKLYELSYFISPDIAEDRLVAEVNKIKELVTENKGEIAREQMPQRRKLSYPIRHKQQGYFGFVHFYVNRDTIRSMDQKLKLDGNILRHLIISVTQRQMAHLQKPARNLMAEEKMRKATDKTAVEKAIFKKEDAVSSAEEQKVELGDLDKKLEEILNK